MLGLDDDPDAPRREPLVEPVGDLLSQALLHLQAARERFDDTRQFGQAEDALTGQVPDVGDTVERQEVVLAERLKGDVPGEHEFVVALVVGEGGEVEGAGREELGEGACDPPGRVDQVLGGRVVTQRHQERGHGLRRGVEVDGWSRVDHVQGHGVLAQPGHVVMLDGDGHRDPSGLSDSTSDVRDPNTFRQALCPIESRPLVRPWEKPLRSDLNARLDRVAVLGEPARRALYRFVAAQSAPVNREQAAAGVGVAHHVAKFHLDRLVDEGLLEAEYRRPAGRGGPGAGRPTKLYRRTMTDVEVSVPPRRYDLAGRLLVRAAARAERNRAPLAETLDQVASDAGRDIGATATAAATAAAPRSRRQARDAVLEVLEGHGFEPQSGPDGITLSNCPFHALAVEETDLVCGMNLSFLRGVLDGSGATGLRAALEPAPGRCCVMLRED